MTTYGMVTKMHDEGMSSYYEPFSITTRGAGDVHATIIDSPPPRDMLKKNIQRRIEGERGHYVKQNKKHTHRRCCCTEGTNRCNARNRQVIEGTIQQAPFVFVHTAGYKTVIEKRGKKHTSNRPVI